MVDSVSISITSAIVYGVFGAVFFLLIFLLVRFSLEQWVSSPHVFVRKNYIQFYFFRIPHQVVAILLLYSDQSILIFLGDGWSDRLQLGL